MPQGVFKSIKKKKSGGAYCEGERSVSNGLALIHELQLLLARRGIVHFIASGPLQTRPAKLTGMRGTLARETKKSDYRTGRGRLEEAVGNQRARTSGRETGNHKGGWAASPLIII